MAGEQDDRIRDRAYAIWVEEGRPEGRHDDHWRRAEEEIASAGTSDPGETDGAGDPTSAEGKSDPVADPSVRNAAADLPPAIESSREKDAARRRGGKDA